MTKHIFWLASYPKSGNTLLRAILSSLFFTENGVFNFKLLESITNFEDTYFVYKMKQFIGNDLNKLKSTTIFYKYLLKIQEKENHTKATEVMKFLNLDHLESEKAGSLSGGQKKLLELGRTMMVDARLVLLDEVGAGVNKTLLKKIGESIKKLNKELGYTFFMIEHDIDFISSLCDPVIVMTDGSVLTQGTVNEIKNDDRVIEAYLGN